MAELRRQMNGAISQTMRELGQQDYINFGVSLPTIKQIAATYAVDHALACELSERRVREARIAALYIADPVLLTVHEAELWSQGWNNEEIARLCAMVLLHRSPVAIELATQWLGSDNRFRHIAALYIIGKRSRDTEPQLIRKLLQSATDDAATIFALRELYFNREDFKSDIVQLAKGIEELRWQIEEEAL